MAHPESKRVIYAALAGNGLIAVTKFAAAALTGSSAMLSEAIHSLVDMGNQGLLMIGLHRARRPADEQHPFGYGMELYFWTFVVAILIFAVGAGVSINEGIQKLQSPHPIRDPWINFLVLGFAVVFEGVAWMVAYRAFRRERGKLGFLAAVHRSKDPTVFTVLFEDSAAMLGLVAAGIGVALAWQTGDPAWDAAASIAIGVILAVTAVLLARESKGLLIGEGARPELIRKVRAILEDQPEVERTNELLTMHLGPEDILLTVSLDFRNDIPAQAVEKTIARLERAIKEAHPEISRIFIEAQSWQAHLRDARATAARQAAEEGTEGPKD